jgi:hypothetical protein
MSNCSVSRFVGCGTEGNDAIRKINQLSFWPALFATLTLPLLSQTAPLGNCVASLQLKFKLVVRAIDVTAATS